MQSLSKGKAEYSMPIVFVSKKEDGNIPVELSQPAFELQGVAHVLYEGDKMLPLDFKDYFGCKSHNEMIFVIYQDQNMKRNVIYLIF